MSQTPLRTSSRRILVVAPQPFYEDRGTPIAVRHLLEALSQLGGKVDLVTYALGQPIDIPGVTLYRTSNPFGFGHVPIGFSLRKVILDLFLIKVLWDRLRSQEYDLVFAVEEGAFLAALFRQKFDLSIAYDMQSSLPEQMTKHVVFRSRFIQRVLRWLEKWLLHRVDFVACSVGLAEYASSVCPGVELREWLFPSLSLDTDPEKVAELREELGIPPQDRMVLYSGTFETYQGLQMLLEAIPQIATRAPDTVFVLVGATGDEELKQTESLIDPAYRDRVRIVSRQPRERMNLFLGAADLLVSPRLHGKNLPLKVFDYLAAGKPIVATAIPAHLKVLDSSLALLVQPTPESLGIATAGLLEDPTKMAQLGAAANTYAKDRLTWMSYLRSVDDMCDRVHP